MIFLEQVYYCIMKVYFKNGIISFSNSLIYVMFIKSGVVEQDIFKYFSEALEVFPGILYEILIWKLSQYTV